MEYQPNFSQWTIYTPQPYADLNEADYELAKNLAPYLLQPHHMWSMGYPTLIEGGLVALYRDSPQRPVTFQKLDAGAPEFIPRTQGDSGCGSTGSSTRTHANRSETDRLACVRCEKKFKVTGDGNYVGAEFCIYHWGRIHNGRYSCCGEYYGSQGCTSGIFHVWTGTVPGVNGPLEGYVQAKTARGGVYAVDAEMCYTTAGLELASIVFIKPNGRIVYKSLVKPSSPVLDCNTRFSGIRSCDLARASKSLRDVQNDILGFVGPDTILIGHALENDLRALKLIHGAIIDTSALYPHPRGFPLRRSLKALSEEFLGRIIQSSTHNVGHMPLEDAQAAMDLVLHKLNMDFNENKINGRCQI